MIDIDDIHSVYFIGIGGIGMSATAGIAKTAQFEVEGSDSKALYDPAKEVLERHGIPYHVGYDAKHIDQSKAGVFIISAGEDLHNPEVAYVYEKNLPHMSFAQFLGQVFKEKLRVVVAGTHGKSTTSGLLGFTLQQLDDSSYMTGGVITNTGGNFWYGDGHYAVFEGDEYKSEFDDATPKFHHYKADILVLTNLEYDHPDLFSSYEDMENEFIQLIEAVPHDGLIVYNADDANLARLVHRSNVSSVSFGIDNEADYKATEIKYESDYTTIELMNKFSRNLSSKLLNQTEQYKTQLAGKINVYNSLAVIATLRALGFAQEQLALELLSYRGIKRRFEKLGEKNGVTIIDDYAHHPTAVKETLDAARLRYPKARIWAIFEPHTYSRTQATLPAMLTAFDSADQVLISKIYPAREKASAASITSEEVVNAIKDKRVKTDETIRVVQSKQEALDLLKSELKSGDVVIVMAVGEFNRLGYELKEVL